MFETGHGLNYYLNLICFSEKLGENAKIKPWKHYEKMAFLLTVFEPVEEELTVNTDEELEDLLEEELGEGRGKLTRKRKRVETDEKYSAIVESDQDSGKDDPTYEPVFDRDLESSDEIPDQPLLKKTKLQPKIQEKALKVASKKKSKPKNKLELIQESDAQINNNLNTLTAALTKSLIEPNESQSSKQPTSKNFNFLMSLADSMDSITDQKKLNELRMKIFALINEYI